MDLAAHLETYGIRHFGDDSYRAWRSATLGPERESELEKLRGPLQQPDPSPRQLAAYWDYVVQPEISSPFFSGKAGAIRAAGEFATAHLPPTGRILDIGCSFGYLTAYYALASPDARLTGIDLSEASIARADAEAADRGIRNVTFLRGDWLTAISGMQFDCLVATQALARAWQDSRAAARLASLLTPGGHFICVESFGPGQAGAAFVASCAERGLRLRSVESLRFADLGVPETAPAFVFQR